MSGKINYQNKPKKVGIRKLIFYNSENIVTYNNMNNNLVMLVEKDYI